VNRRGLLKAILCCSTIEFFAPIVPLAKMIEDKVEYTKVYLTDKHGISYTCFAKNKGSGLWVALFEPEQDTVIIDAMSMTGRVFKMNGPIHMAMGDSLYITWTLTAKQV
jgi:hypothetical protein